MKTLLIPITITALLTSVCWSIAIEMREAYNQAWLISSVKAPGRMALEEIDKDLNDGKIADAKTKLRIFKAEWKGFEEENGIGMGIGNIMVEFARTPPSEKQL